MCNSILNYDHRYFINCKQITKLDFSSWHSHLFIYYRDLANLEKQFQIHHVDKDYSLILYPLHVLTTNRACNTTISRQRGPEPIRWYNDLKSIRSISGLSIGFVAYFLCYISKAFQTETFTKIEGLYTLDPIILPSEPNFNINKFSPTEISLGTQMLIFSFSRNIAQMSIMNISNLIVIRM